MREPIEESESIRQREPEEKNERPQICADCGEVFDLKPDEKKSTTTFCSECKQEFFEFVNDDGHRLVFRIIRKVWSYRA